MSHFRTTGTQNTSIMCITCIIIPRYTHVIHSVIHMLDIIQYKVNVYNVTLPHIKIVHNMHNYTTLYTHVIHSVIYMLDIIQYKVNVYNVILTHNCASVYNVHNTYINPLP